MKQGTSREAPEAKAAKRAPALAAKARAPVVFRDAAAWSAWLAAKHASSPGVWLKIAKKGAAAVSVTYAQALEVALAWGWIDGQKDKFDDAWWLQRFTPRAARSLWSKRNCESVTALIASGKMNPAGLAEVARAQADGRWDAAYASPKNMAVPPDLASALAGSPRAARFFEGLESRNRYAILFRIHTAKKSETRAQRIGKFVAMLARGEKLHP